MRFYWLLAALLLSLAVASIHYLAIDRFLYWHYVWLDVPVHFLGGLTIGTFLVYLSPRFRPRAYIAALVLVILGWEVFEYVFGTPKDDNYLFDTAIDLLMGALGAITVYIIARFTLWRSV